MFDTERKTYSKRIALLCLVCLSVVVTEAAGSTMQFRHITNREGLKYTWVWNIAKDSRGYMWFSTMYGAYRYNGFDFEEYSFINRADSVVTSVNFVFESSDGFLWFGTNDGLYRNDRRYNTYNHYTTDTTGTLRLSSLEITGMVEDADNNLWISSTGGIDRVNPNVSLKSYFIGNGQRTEGVRSIFCDSRRTIWVGTYSGNVYRYDNAKDCFAAVDLPFHTGGTIIMNIFEDSKHNVWIGTQGRGVIRYDMQRDDFTLFSTADKTLPNDIVRAVVEDVDGNIFIGTEKGLVRFDGNETEFIFSRGDNPWSLNDNAIYSIYTDESGNVWIGTFFGGVNVLYRQLDLFDFILSTSEEYQANSKVVSSIVSYGNGIIIGTENNGIYMFDSFDKTPHNINTSNSNLNSDNIHTICLDNRENLWVGSYYGGLHMKPKGSDRFLCFRCNQAACRSLGRDNIYSIIQDSRDNLWVGTQYGGLSRYNYATKTFEPFPEGLSRSLFVWDILEDGIGNIWLACYGDGVYRLSSSQNYAPRKIVTTARNFVTLCELSDGTILVGTEKEGIIEIDNLTLEAKQHTQADGLLDNTVYGILQDNSGNIWFSTNSGLCKADADMKSFTNYTIADGLPTNRFNYNSCAKIDNRLYFGSTNGVVVVNPDNSFAVEMNHPILFNNLYINSRKEAIIAGGVLDEDLNTINRLTLKYNQNTFGVDFSSNVYGYNFGQNFAYRMIGVDNYWHSLGQQHKVDFIGLAPGHYNLTVCSLDNDSHQTGNSAQLDIYIKPVWWQSIYARTGMVVVAVLIIIYLIYFFIQTSKHRHALELEKLAREKDKEINEMKCNFFVNISHEFKTPLSLILGPIEQFIEGGVKPESTSRYFNIIKKNADKLLGLINELLAFREVQFAELKISKIAISQFVDSVLLRYGWLFEEKRIKVEVSIPDDIVIEADADKLEKIFDNLLSNAYKHTPQDGEVKITILRCDDNLRFTIYNNGEGITADKLPYIFDRFFTGQSYDKYSSGVGLSYVKSLIELHHGTITASSDVGVFTSIEFMLPGRQTTAPSPTQSENGDEYNVSIFKEQSLTNDNAESDFDADRYKSLAAETTLLIVEDDAQMRELLVDFFSQRYIVMDAANGEAAAQIVHENKVDIVVSDVMMIGGMSGFELCHYIKNNIETSHVKVVLMTVLSEQDYKFKGYRSGADAYIIKPFEFPLLELRIKNLIISAYKMREAYKIDIDLSNVDIPSSNSDEQLMRKVVDVIFKHLSESEFSIDDLCWNVGMSKATLYRKLKAISGQSINEFIQNVRLKYAARLLQETDKPVSDIGYEVGFSDPYYFSRAFKKYFSLSPKQWREENANTADE